jgi:hypothetical protein
MKIVCFDFDGVLASYTEWDGGIGDPIPGGLDLIRRCRKAGYKIIISTCRTHPQHDNQIQQYYEIIDWLRVYEVPWDKIDLEGKPTAHVYIDDRGLSFDQSAGIKLGGYGKLLFKEIARRMEDYE